MAQIAPAAPSRLRDYQDFLPTFEWVRDDTADTLLVDLPDFKREQLKVQIDNHGNLRVSGERPIGANKWSRFRKDFSLHENATLNQIRAKFEDGILYVIVPKLITKAEPIEQPPPPPREKPMPESIQKPPPPREKPMPESIQKPPPPREKPMPESIQKPPLPSEKPIPEPIQKPSPPSEKPITEPIQNQPLPSEKPIPEPIQNQPPPREKPMPELTPSAKPAPPKVPGESNTAAAKKQDEQADTKSDALHKKNEDGLPLKDGASDAKKKEPPPDGGYQMEKTKSGVALPALGIGEPRQLFVNVVVAVIVLVALAVYLNYKMRKSGEAEREQN